MKCCVLLFSSMIAFAAMAVYADQPADSPSNDPQHTHPAPASKTAEPPKGEPMQHDMPGMQHEMHMVHSDPLHQLLMRQASGTSMNPAAEPMHMAMTSVDQWTVMLHGLAFVNQTWQTGPRGEDKLFSTNWVMGMADRRLGNGRLMLRSMLSLEPATVTHRSYPLLFQTGETAYGRPLHDAQHPHDFFMELAAEYAQPVAGGIGYVYIAPVGDPSLGPVAFPHRSSAMEIPQATLGHHVQDSTHVAYNVVTAGWQYGIFGAAVSAFHGAEPDEHRWDIDGGGIDSWAIRLTADPTPNWTGQISTGHLRKPEALEPGDVQRTTASVTYSAPSIVGRVSTSLVFGHNSNEHGHSTTSWLAESTVNVGTKNWLTARAEVVDKNELFAGQAVPDDIADRTFRIRSLLVGYTRDVWSNEMITGGVGGNVTTYGFPSGLEPYYGKRPLSYFLFVRLKSAGGM